MRDGRESGKKQPRLESGFVDFLISPPKTATKPVNIVRDGRESGKKQAMLESGLMASQYRPARKREGISFQIRREQKIN